MPHEFLSDEQIARYARFPDEVSIGDLEQFFRLDAKAHETVATKRLPATKLGWALQWGTVRMLGVFLPDNPTGVPDSVVPFVADQLGVDPNCVGEYRRRWQTAYEHAQEIRDAFGYTEFSEREEGLREYLAARVWATEDGPRTLFDRAVVHLVEKKVLLPGMTVLARVVTNVCKSENARLHASLHQRTPHTIRLSRTVSDRDNAASRNSITHHACWPWPTPVASPDATMCSTRSFGGRHSRSRCRSGNFTRTGSTLGAVSG